MKKGWKRRKEERPGEILAAARRLFTERGIGVKVREIAVACGISKGTIYLYFPSKAALYREAMEVQR